MKRLFSYQNMLDHSSVLSGKERSIVSLSQRFYFVTVMLATAFMVGSVADPALAGEPVLQEEESDVIRLPPVTSHRILVQDVVGEHAKDGRVYVVDADAGKLLGMVQAAYNANVVQDPGGKAFYVAETVWSRGNRGDRADLLPAYDPQTLTITNDEVLPGRALITPKKNDLSISNDGKNIYVFSMVPTSAVYVVESISHKVAQTVDVPGCSLTYPWGNSGFTSICADGGLVNVSLSGNHATAEHTTPFFDPEKDAVFEHSPTRRPDGRTWFISYSGLVYPASLSANTKIEAAWSLQEAAGMKRAPAAEAPFVKTWRPGGWQLSALHYASGHLFVLMHMGTFWTHKQAGTEVWELEVDTHRLLRRIRLPHPSTMVGVTQDARPLMFTTDKAGAFCIWDATTGKFLRQIPHLGEDLYFTVALGE
ncbi:amine dehydrogenase [Acetobacter sp. LMG 1636]|uniref:Amine dehydrogenase n=1 Tax=Acetobacter fallax TaxID=1737473 RepID=A0ABX0KAY7_9PROT|nr:amine dehydrogenase large subunit [Acetobacter fallax]NHO32594.1 amine dehydrogenase [Acetobacter fallax]NHO36208.1 amine dehydrogenase [Acetobacter fallax]